jgi:superfamily II DNA or RNA helicase
MIGDFYEDLAISSSSWAGFERLVMRILVSRGFQQCSVVGQSGDGGADVLGISNGKRWLLQVKAYARPIGPEVIAETLAAKQKYDADIPVIVSKTGFTSEVYEHQKKLQSENITLQLWDRIAIRSQGDRLPRQSRIETHPEDFLLRPYQEEAVQRIVRAKKSGESNSALVVLATGLGKTFVAGEAIRRMRTSEQRVLVVAHTVDLVLQLEKAFWPFLAPSDSTTVLTGSDRPKSWSDLQHFSFVFATRDSIDSLLSNQVELPRFDYVVVDECHHLGAEVYERVLDGLEVGQVGGPFLLGLTATPWRPDGTGLDHRFGEPVVNVDLARGLKDGYLANVDYRMFTDNVDWDSLRNLHGDSFSPKAINRTMFIQEWDDAVIDRLQEAWHELGSNPRGIVFCGTIDHAERMAAKINALGITNAKAIFSGKSGVDRKGPPLTPVERNKMLWDFNDGRIGILCSIDILNEGVDVPDVNLVVFQRVTHSRRIFTQQLGRGLRLAKNKEKVIVLDFVTDVRRFAAGLQLDRALNESRGPRPGSPVVVKLNSKVSFMRASDPDESGKEFLREWLKDLDEIEDAGEDVSILTFPNYSDSIQSQIESQLRDNL